MSIHEIETVVLLFPNEDWSNTATNSALNSVVQQLRPNISFAQSTDDNLVTLSTNNADRDGTISGFLYVPDLDMNDACYQLSKHYVPTNVTRQANLPPTDFTLIAIAPWISADCAGSYMDAAHNDPARGFLFYLPNDTAVEPPPPSSDVWDMGDGGSWKDDYQFPIYAIPQSMGLVLMHQLSLYSGNLTAVPYGHQISELPGIDPRDYVRLYTQLDVSRATSLPVFWVFIVVVFAVLVVVLGSTSALMHLVQRSRRKSLQQRIESGEVNLEALGIKRLTLSPKFIERLPLFTYTAETEKSMPMSPLSAMSPLAASHLDPGTVASKTISSSIVFPESERPLIAPHILVQDDSISNPDSVLVHKFLPYSQPTCAICLEDFESGVSEIRELPCGHIFHPECIDAFLANNSSLCPMCKKSALPVGFCPTKITNAMVWRERNLRRLRSRVTVAEDANVESRKQPQGLHYFGRKIKRSMMRSPNPRESYQLPTQPQPVLMTSALPARRPYVREDETDIQSSRRELVEQRIRELRAAQVPIHDPDLSDDRRKPKWLKTLARAFPGF